MFEQAESLFDVDKEHSWMIGDKRIDVQAGRNYGVRTVLVGTGYGKAEKNGDRYYDVYAETLMDAAGAIIGWEDSDRESEQGNEVK